MTRQELDELIRDRVMLNTPVLIVSYRSMATGTILHIESCVFTRDNLVAMLEEARKCSGNVSDPGPWVHSDNTPPTRH